MNLNVGQCSICRGQVTVPTVWNGVIAPLPTCERCGASARGPVIEMTPIKTQDNSDFLRRTRGTNQ